ncbi:MAG: DUF2461 domain-containing protein [Lachnospiraceae bacterium]|nr:DUF2461 domain-containing protein [Lachnospiraceae bacterium]
MPFTQQTINFLVENRLNDSREWFRAHHAEYQQHVITPLAELVRDLTPCMQAIDPEFVTEPRVDRTISRIWRDTRYTKDPSLYRDNMWIIFKRSRMHGTEYPGIYFEIAPDGFNYGGGFYNASASFMEKLREKIVSGDKLAGKALKAFRVQDVFALEGERYKRAHYPGESAGKREWLERKNVCLIAESTDMELLFSDGLAAKLEEDFRKIAPVYELFLKAAQEDAAEQAWNPVTMDLLGRE